METVTLTEIDRQARARYVFKHGDRPVDEDALAVERQNVRAMLAQIGHPLEPEPPKSRTEAPAVFGDRRGRPVDWW